MVEHDGPAQVSRQPQQPRFRIAVVEREQVIAHVVRRAGVGARRQHVAGEQNAACAAVYQNRLLAAGVSGRGDAIDARRRARANLFKQAGRCGGVRKDAAYARVKPPCARLVERCEVFLAIRHGHDAEVCPRVVVFELLHVYDRPWERRQASVAVATRQTTGVVEVQVRDDDVGDLVSADAALLDCRQEPSGRIDAVDLLLLGGKLLAVAGFDHDAGAGAVPLNEQRVTGQLDAIQFVGGCIARPQHLRNDAEHRAAVELERSGLDELHGALAQVKSAWLHPIFPVGTWGREPARTLHPLQARLAASCGYHMPMAEIGALCLDVDGVLTDGRLYIGPSGEIWRAYDIMDGFALKQFQRELGPVCILTGKGGDSITARASDLGIEHVVTNSADKQADIEQLAGRLAVPLDRMAMIGDDLPDLPALRACGCPIAVANAAPQVRAVAKYVTERSGGRGAVREAVEWLLGRAGRWNRVLERYGAAPQATSERKLS